MKSILVTGAGGFIGGWIAEAVHLSGAWQVRAGLRSWSKAARIARFPLDIVLCDIANRDSLDAALKGIDVVINCALVRGPSSSATMDLLLERAKAARVRKVVHLSSIAVYGGAEGVVSEKTPVAGALDGYAADKHAAEQACEAAASDALPISVLRPTLVYGPFSDTWTLPYIARIASGRWSLLGPLAEGRANLIYIGDLIRFALFLAEVDVGSYAVFNANGPELPTWNEYFERLNLALGRGPLPAPAAAAGLGLTLRRPVRAVVRYLKDRYKDEVLALAARSAILDQLRQSMQSDLRFHPDPDELRLYGQNVVYSIDKAKRFGFEPTTSLDDGLSYCVEWARDAGLI
jgi:nucleoside-diphosphate-sugar epimerase